MRGSRHHHARRLGTRGAARKRQQRDVASSLNGHAQPTLMTRTDPGHPPRQNLSTFLHELRQDVRALVVDEIHLLDTKLANFLLPEILALSARSPAGTAWPPGSCAARCAFAPRTSVSTARPAVTAMATNFAPGNAARCWCLFLFL
jgi:hypothetical protein